MAGQVLADQFFVVNLPNACFREIAPELQLARARPFNQILMAVFDQRLLPVGILTRAVLEHKSCPNSKCTIRCPEEREGKETVMISLASLSLVPGTWLLEALATLLGTLRTGLQFCIDLREDLLGSFPQIHVSSIIRAISLLALHKT